MYNAERSLTIVEPVLDMPLSLSLAEAKGAASIRPPPTTSHTALYKQFRHNRQLYLVFEISLIGLIFGFAVQPTVNN